VSWQIADEYMWTADGVAPTHESPIRLYSPLAYIEIATDLARVAAGEERLEEWVNAYGMLNWGSIETFTRSNSDIEPESRASFMVFADETRLCIEAIIGFKNDSTNANFTRVIELVSPHLDQIHPRLVGVSRNGSVSGVNFGWALPTLKNVIMLHLADFAVDAQANVRSCEECGSFFAVSHGKQRFCPPVKGAGWSSNQPTRESRCALRARQRRQRAGKASS